MVGMGGFLLSLEHQADGVSGDAQHAGAVFERGRLDAFAGQAAGEADGGQQQLALGLLAQFG
jgi:hypothetical protein